MVTFCIGSARQKRAYFAKMNDAIVLDNVEVLFCVSENGRNYFAYGDVPFGGFCVADYLRYKRAFCGAPPPCALKSLGLKPQRLLERLAPAEMRCVELLEKAYGKNAKTTVVNLDGAKYSRRNAAALGRLLRACPDAYVCVTDDRFVRRFRAPFETLAFGSPVRRVRPDFFAAERLAKLIGAKRVGVM